MTTAKSCISAVFAAPNPGVSTGPSMSTATRYWAVLVQMWVSGRRTRRCPTARRTYRLISDCCIHRTWHPRWRRRSQASNAPVWQRNRRMPLAGSNFVAPMVTAPLIPSGPLSDKARSRCPGSLVHAVGDGDGDPRRSRSHPPAPRCRCRPRPVPGSRRTRSAGCDPATSSRSREPVCRCSLGCCGVPRLPPTHRSRQRLRRCSVHTPPAPRPPARPTVRRKRQSRRLLSHAKRPAPIPFPRLDMAGRRGRRSPA